MITSAKSILTACQFFSALQLTDRHKVTTPVNWRPGDDVVVHAAVPTEEARKLFPNLVEHKVSAPRLGYLAVHTDELISGSITSGRRRSLHKRKKYSLWNIDCTVSTCNVQLSFHGDTSLFVQHGAVEGIKNI
jgi:hypothetical protein